MPAAPEEIDAADALVREGFPQARLWQVSAWPGVSRLADWAPDASAAQVDHLSADSTVAVSVRTVHGRRSARVLRRMHGEKHLQRGHADHRETRVGVPEASYTVTISVDGQPVAARRWDEEDSWWLAADLADSTALVVAGAAGTPAATELRTVTDVEPLLAARRTHLLRPQS